MSTKSTVNTQTSQSTKSSNSNHSSSSRRISPELGRDGDHGIHHEHYKDLVPLQIEDVYRRQLEAAQGLRTTNGHERHSQPQKVQSQQQTQHLVELKEEEEFQEGLKALYSPRPFEDEEVRIQNMDDALAMSLPRSPLCDQVNVLSMGQMEGVLEDNERRERRRRKRRKKRRKRDKRGNYRHPSFGYVGNGIDVVSL